MSSLPKLAPKPSGSGPVAVERPSSREHTEEEWLAKKELIRKLYIVDKRKLNDIQTMMETQHGFAATYEQRPRCQRALSLFVKGHIN